MKKCELDRTNHHTCIHSNYHSIINILFKSFQTTESNHATSHNNATILSYELTNEGMGSHSLHQHDVLDVDIGHLHIIPSMVTSTHIIICICVVDAHVRTAQDLFDSPPLKAHLY